MIKNERQYRITKAQAAKFGESLEVKLSDDTKAIHPVLRKAQTDALRSQLDELNQQIAEYEELRDGKYKILEVASFEELPDALIKARIASGLSQRELAETLGLKEQQLQRYEATGFSSASLERLKEIINALNIKVREEIFLPSTDLSLAGVVSKLKAFGLDESFVKHRLVPKQTRDYLTRKGHAKGEEGTNTLLLLSRLTRIFGVTASEILNLEDFSLLDRPAFSLARFKRPKNSSENKVSAYAVYAHFLSLLTLEVTDHLTSRTLLTEPVVLRSEIEERFGELTFESMLRYLWYIGVPVLPLDDPGAFHGACWRVKGRNIIVLKQKNKSQARWLFDLLHEFYHICQSPDEDSFTIIEEVDSKEKYSIEEEFEASKFAGEVGLLQRAEELAEKCADFASGSVERLKQAVPVIAHKEAVRADFLANYLAFRLSLQNINWWGTASNLQDKTVDPLRIARKVFFEYADLSRLNTVDREILLQALTDDGT